ncbi:MAG: HlyD family secretion protein [Verrucomicrobia bacterium]|nr:HlyD family secretion protein [Verrucomicrobiota bacterium]MDE3097994.1 HlyD family secretion protein [Verrucomicrobiota bacterium]
MSESHPAAPAAPPQPLAGKRLAVIARPVFLLPAAVILAVVLFLGLRYLVFAFTYESTDDAFIAGNVVSIAPRVDGQVAAVYVNDNEMVHSNQALLELDPSDYKVTLSQKQTLLEAGKSNYKAAVAGYQLMKAKVATARADVKRSKADAAAAAATAKQAAADFNRARELLKQHTISPQEFDQFKTAADKAAADEQAARDKAASDASKVNEAQAQLDVAAAEAGAMLAQVNQSTAAMNAAQLDLSYTKIFAPADGRVTRKQVETGDYVETGQIVMSIVPTNVWVIANFKETQLKNMKPGQEAIVSIDALGGRTFRAHVDSIQSGSGEAFSLLPPENATGNYVKVVQRVPVKILFDEPLPADRSMGPGLSVEPGVRVSALRVPGFAVVIAVILLAGGAAAAFRLIVKLQDAGG